MIIHSAHNQSFCRLRRQTALGWNTGNDFKKEPYPVTLFVRHPVTELREAIRGPDVPNKSTELAGDCRGHLVVMNATVSQSAISSAQPHCKS